ncbi:SSI family serine proteinase inhibitor [Nocardiopsis sp. ATB16-24]|uniref:SSI family serine proteinase inhibitor n=1 Tax=Nocardiopsis sp. ATB16-24 TaxID=3019555 RepID=UPI0025560680|nr:SSI family serine proteinase inhibitor [Nocardiopsis sp. ATB16-24]
MAEYTFAASLPTRLAALAALGLLVTACGNEPTGVDTPTSESEQSDGNEDSPDSSTGEASEEEGGEADVRLTIERSLSDDESLAPEEGYEEGVWTLTCGPEGGDHPDAEAACAQIEETGTEPFVLDTSDMMCTMQVGGPEVVHVTGHVDGTEVDTEFNKLNGCEISRFESVEKVLAP